MALKKKLLATAAIPLIALMGISSVSAAGFVRTDAPAQAQSLIVKVQATDDELQQQKRKERRENRKNQNDAAGQDDQGNNGNKRRNKQNDAQAQQDDSEQVQPQRRKKQQQAEEQQQMQQSDQQEVVPQRKKNKQNSEAQQQDNANQAQPNDAETMQPRRKKQNDNVAAEQNQPSDEELKNALERNKQRKHKDVTNEDNADTGNRQRKKDKQNQDQAEQPADNNGSIQNVETPRKNKPNQAEQTGEDQPLNKAKAENPVDVKKASQIAADPSKTSETVVLPVENGAAVLDSDKDADNRGDKNTRERRKREREEVKPVRVPKSDKDAQAGFQGDKQPIRVKPVLEQRGERIPGFKGYDDAGGRRVGKNDKDDRVIINIGGHVVIRGSDDSRLGRRSNSRYEQLPNGQIREIVVRPNGDKVVTVRNRYGEVVRRSRIDSRDREVVIFYSPDLERGRDRLFLRDPGAELPPMRLRIPVRDYIIDVSSDRNRNYEQFLDQPPVEPVERVYSVDEVKYSARIRDKMRRIDLDTITFETGSADIDMSQASSLKQVGAAIREILNNDPGETFLIEGHTDAVGSDESNLVLSDSRADSVADVLSDLYDIPPENLVTQGYGERYLKIDTDGPARENRRVTIRRITPLVRPLASAE